MTSHPQQVEFTRYSLNFWPPKPYESRMVTPLTDAPFTEERLSDDLLFVLDRSRRMGFLATNDWLDIDQFKMATGWPPAANFYREIPGRDDPNYRRLKSQYHMRPATMLFKAICLSPDVTLSKDEPLVRCSSSPDSVYSVAEYVRLSSGYNKVASLQRLNYLLLSRDAVTRLAQGQWSQQDFARSRIGDVQLEIVDRLVDQPTSPYISPEYDFDA